jgi:hypothetical protein
MVDGLRGTGDKKTISLPNSQGCFKRKVTCSPTSRGMRSTLDTLHIGTSTRLRRLVTTNRSPRSSTVSAMLHRPRRRTTTNTIPNNPIAARDSPIVAGCVFRLFDHSAHAQANKNASTGSTHFMNTECFAERIFTVASAVYLRIRRQKCRPRINREKYLQQHRRPPCIRSGHNRSSAAFLVKHQANGWFLEGISAG